MKRFLTLLIPIVLATSQTLPSAYAQSDVEPAAQTEELSGGTAEQAGDESVQEAPVAAAPAKDLTTGFLNYGISPLVISLVSESVQNDDIALMGIVNGARTYCGLDWQPSFVRLINIANRQGLVLEMVADDHGYYMGAARRALAKAEYKCTQQDFVDLRSINPY